MEMNTNNNTEYVIVRALNLCGGPGTGGMYIEEGKLYAVPASSVVPVPRERRTRYSGDFKCGRTAVRYATEEEAGSYDPADTYRVNPSGRFVPEIG